MQSSDNPFILSHLACTPRAKPVVSSTCTEAAAKTYFSVQPHPKAGSALCPGMPHPQHLGQTGTVTGARPSCQRDDRLAVSGRQPSSSTRGPESPGRRAASEGGGLRNAPARGQPGGDLAGDEPGQPPCVSVPATVTPFLYLGQAWVHPLAPRVLGEPAHLPFQARAGSSPAPTSITPETTSVPSTHQEPIRSRSTPPQSHR